MRSLLWMCVILLSLWVAQSTNLTSQPTPSEATDQAIGTSQVDITEQYDLQPISHSTDAGKQDVQPITEPTNEGQQDVQPITKFNDVGQMVKANNTDQLLEPMMNKSSNSTCSDVEVSAQTTGGPVLALVDNSLDIVSYVTIPTFTTFGLFGNAMTLIVVTNPAIKHNGMTVVLLALAISDSVVICISPFNIPAVSRLFRVDFMSQSLVSCKLINFVNRTSRMFSSWLIMFIAAERMCAVLFPLKAKVMLTRKIVAIILLISLAILLIFNGVWSVFCTRIVQGKCIINYPAEPQYAYLTHGFVIACSIIRSYLPISMTVLFNVMIVACLARHSKARSWLINESSPLQSQTDIKWMLFSVSLIFLLLSSPNCFFRLYLLYEKIQLHFTEDPTLKVVREVVQVLELLVHAINFYMYVLVSRVFRQVFRQLCSKTHGGTESSSSLSNNQWKITNS